MTNEQFAKLRQELYSLIRLMSVFTVATTLLLAISTSCLLILAFK